MRNKLKRICALMLALLCMAGISVTAFAMGGEDVGAGNNEASVSQNAVNNDEAEAETPQADKTDPDNTEPDKTEHENAEDIDIPFHVSIGEDGSLVVTIDGVTESIKTTTTGTVVTGGSRLNLRTGAGMGYEVIDQLRPGEEVTVVGTDGDWYEVIVPEKKGYVHSDYLKISSQGAQSLEIDPALLSQLMEMLGLTNKGDETAEGGKSPFAFTPDGNLTLVDDFLQIIAPATEDSEQLEKQFVTLQSKNGNTFYLVIDRNGDTENVYFMNLVDEADLMALMEDENRNTNTPACTCTDKCVVGAINTNCEVCRSNLSECTGKEPTPEPEPDESADEPEEKPQGNKFLPIIILVLAAAGGGAVYWLKFRKPKTKTKGNSDLDDYDFGEDDGDDEETEIDDADLMAETESEDTE